MPRQKKNVLDDLPLEVVKFPYISGARISLEAAYWIAEHVYYAAYDHGDDFLKVSYRGDGTPPPTSAGGKQSLALADSEGDIPTPNAPTQEFHMPYTIKTSGARVIRKKEPKPITLVDSDGGFNFSIYGK